MVEAVIVTARSINVEAGTITYAFKEDAPDSEFQGRPCHTVDPEVSGGEMMRAHLRFLGYEHIGCGFRQGLDFWRRDHIEYWAKREPIGPSGGDA